VALYLAGRRPAALDALAESLRVGGPQGYVRGVLDAGPVVGGLLREVATSGPDALVAAHATRVLELVDDDLPPLADPLTPRELDVLALLAAGRRNRDIADELLVSTDTVKKHVSQVLRKLSATNRTEAVARATALGLAP
jgi:LuxR family maltose regulon positive regulatory protein